MGRLGTAAPGRELIAGSGQSRGAVISTACRQVDPPPRGVGRVKDVSLPCQRALPLARGATARMGVGYSIEGQSKHSRADGLQSIPHCDTARRVAARSELRPLDARRDRAQHGVAQRAADRTVEVDCHAQGRLHSANPSARPHAWPLRGAHRLVNPLAQLAVVRQRDASRRGERAVHSHARHEQRLRPSAGCRHAAGQEQALATQLRASCWSQRLAARRGRRSGLQAGARGPVCAVLPASATAGSLRATTRLRRYFERASPTCTKSSKERGPAAKRSRTGSPPCGST
jgi:hypothetical protein